MASQMVNSNQKLKLQIRDFQSALHLTFSILGLSSEYKKGNNWAPKFHPALVSLSYQIKWHCRHSNHKVYDHLMEEQVIRLTCVPDLQIVVDPGNLVPRQNFSSKKVSGIFKYFFVKINYHNFLWRLSKFACGNAVYCYFIFLDLKYVEHHALL